MGERSAPIGVTCVPLFTLQVRPGPLVPLALPLVPLALLLVPLVPLALPLVPLALPLVPLALPLVLRVPLPLHWRGVWGRSQGPQPPQGPQPLRDCFVRDCFVRLHWVQGQCRPQPPGQQYGHGVSSVPPLRKPERRSNGFERAFHPRDCMSQSRDPPQRLLPQCNHSGHLIPHPICRRTIGPPRGRPW
jgi:hypothetical protein